jgi:hypothetical protein
MPSSIHLSQFDGSNWGDWFGTLEAIITLHEAEDVLMHSSLPTGTDRAEWTSIQKRAKAYLRLYTKPAIYSLIASDTEFPSFKEKWDKLRYTYGGALGSTTVFNLWIQLLSSRLDDFSPMAPQLAKINEAHAALANVAMGITDTQYCLTPLHALPTSYEVVTSTILAPLFQLTYSYFNTLTLTLTHLFLF